jgi:protein involved in polysaccharide export with SLBB domain
MERQTTNWKLVALATLFLTGCSASVPRPEYQASDDIQTPTAAAYRLLPGDEIEIRSSYTPELNAAMTIRPDGKISLDTIGELAAAGLTVDELDSVITARYARYIVEPEITVIVRQFSDQKIFVGGEVARPGLIPYSEKLTVLRAIIQAGGANRSGRLDNVLILRDIPGKGTTLLKVDLKQLVRRGNLAEEPKLQPYDVVFVPRSSISKMNQFVSEYVQGLLPIGTVAGFLWTYRLITRGY